MRERGTGLADRDSGERARLHHVRAGVEAPRFLYRSRQRRQGRQSGVANASFFASFVSYVKNARYKFQRVGKPVIREVDQENHA